MQLKKYKKFINLCAFLIHAFAIYQKYININIYDDFMTIFLFYIVNLNYMTTYYKMKKKNTMITQK